MAKPKKEYTPEELKKNKLALLLAYILGGIVLVVLGGIAFMFFNPKPYITAYINGKEYYYNESVVAIVNGEEVFTPKSFAKLTENDTNPYYCRITFEEERARFIETPLNDESFPLLVWSSYTQAPKIYQTKNPNITLPQEAEDPFSVRYNTLSYECSSFKKSKQDTQDTWGDKTTLSFTKFMQVMLNENKTLFDEKMNDEIFTNTLMEQYFYGVQAADMGISLEDNPTVLTAQGVKLEQQIKARKDGYDAYFKFIQEPNGTTIPIPEYITKNIKEYQDKNQY